MPAALMYNLCHDKYECSIYLLFPLQGLQVHRLLIMIYETNTQTNNIFPSTKETNDQSQALII